MISYLVWLAVSELASPYIVERWQRMTAHLSYITRVVDLPVNVERI